MKKILFFALLMFTVSSFVGCTVSKKCRIHGTLPNNSYEGVRIFLVPAEGPQTAKEVDSVEIKEGKFDFATDKDEVAVIRLDYHRRFGIEDLLVVTEPGDIYVTIDSVSHSHGTPQNDILDKWKNRTESHNRNYISLMRSAAAMKKKDAPKAQKIFDEAQKCDNEYKAYTMKVTENLPDGPLKKFMKKLY